MENLWTKINEEIPQYMNSICEQYKLSCVKIAPLKTALVGKGYAIIIAINRFDVEVSYFLKNDIEHELFLCDNFLTEKFDSNDRKNLIEGSGADIIVRNNLIIISNGLANKWSDILSGDAKWIENYKKSRWYKVGRLTLEELRKIDEYI